jgi:hypothetical protein
MGESRNITGGAYALTIFTAIVPGHEEELRETIEALPSGAESPLARLTQLHTSRLQIFDHLVYQGPPALRDELKSNYLLFTAAFDGALEPFLDAIIDNVGSAADSWWRHCVGYPALADRAAFKRWIRRNQVHTSLFAVASPNESVANVLESLALREKVLEFAISAQGLAADEAQERFRRTFGEVE